MNDIRGEKHPTPCTAEICWVLAEGAEDPEWPGAGGKRMDTDSSIRMRHSSTRQRSLLHSLLASSPRRPQRATRTRTLSLTGLAMFPLRERVEVSLEDGGPPIAVQFSCSVVSDSL